MKDLLENWSCKSSYGLSPLLSINYEKQAKQAP